MTRSKAEEALAKAEQDLRNRENVHAAATAIAALTSQAEQPPLSVLRSCVHALVDAADDISLQPHERQQSLAAFVACAQSASSALAREYNAHLPAIRILEHAAHSYDQEDTESNNLNQELLASSAGALKACIDACEDAAYASQLAADGVASAACASVHAWLQQRSSNSTHSNVKLRVPDDVVDAACAACCCGQPALLDDLERHGLCDLLVQCIEHAPDATAANASEDNVPAGSVNARLRSIMGTAVLCTRKRTRDSLKSNLDNGGRALVRVCELSKLAYEADERSICEELLRALATDDGMHDSLKAAAEAASV